MNTYHLANSSASTTNALPPTLATGTGSLSPAEPRDNERWLWETELKYRSRHFAMRREHDRGNNDSDNDSEPEQFQRADRSVSGAVLSVQEKEMTKGPILTDTERWEQQERSSRNEKGPRQDRWSRSSSRSSWEREEFEEKYPIYMAELRNKVGSTTAGSRYQPEEVTEYSGSADNGDNREEEQSEKKSTK